MIVWPFLLFVARRFQIWKVIYNEELGEEMCLHNLVEIMIFRCQPLEECISWWMHRIAATRNGATSGDKLSGSSFSIRCWSIKNHIKTHQKANKQIQHSHLVLTLGFFLMATLEVCVCLDRYLLLIGWSMNFSHWNVSKPVSVRWHSQHCRQRYNIPLILLQWSQAQLGAKGAWLGF